MREARRASRSCRLQAAAADFDNARQAARTTPSGSGSTPPSRWPRDLLTALDNLDRALHAAKQAGESGPLVRAWRRPLSQFLDVLNGTASRRIECAPGTPFDPNLHEAVMQQPTND